jgi:hypothetical protein
MPEVYATPDLVEHWPQTNEAFVRRDFEAMIRVIYELGQLECARSSAREAYAHL